MQNITKLICSKNKISYIVFNKEFQTLDYNNTIENIIDKPSSLKVGIDVREVMWEIIGIEENILALLNAQTEETIIHFPMILKENEYYDLDIETFISSKGEKLFIAYVIQRAKESLSYVSMIKEINKKTLLYESQIQNSKEQYCDLINQRLLNFNVDMDGFITLVNNAFLYFFDLSNEKIIGQHFSKFFKARDLNLNANATVIFNAKNLKDEVISFHANIIPVTKDSIIYENIIICQDITYLKQIEEELKFAAGHDSLTGLPNRSLLLEKIDNTIEISKKNHTLFCICFIDLNKFKPVNDNYGHHAGDMLLKHIAKILSDFVRKGDIVARIGGDEFIILFNSLNSKEDIDIMQERLNHLPKKHPLIYSKEDLIYFDFSIGIATYPDDANDTHSLIQIADKMMYRNKKSRV